MLILSQTGIVVSFLFSEVHVALKAGAELIFSQMHWLLQQLFPDGAVVVVVGIVDVEIVATVVVETVVSSVDVGLSLVMKPAGCSGKTDAVNRRMYQHSPVD